MNPLEQRIELELELVRPLVGEHATDCSCDTCRARELARTIARTVVQPVALELELALSANTDLEVRLGLVSQGLAQANDVTSDLRARLERNVAKIQAERDDLLEQLAREAERADRAIAERDDARRHLDDALAEDRPLAKAERENLLRQIEAHAEGEREALAERDELRRMLEGRAGR